jgi:hypothetical protein
MTEWDEILKKLNGFDLPDATLQADHIIMQALDGVRVDSHNRAQVREYIIMHLRAAEKRGAKAVVEAKFQNYGCD